MIPAGSSMASQRSPRLSPYLRPGGNKKRHAESHARTVGSVSARRSAPAHLWEGANDDARKGLGPILEFSALRRLTQRGRCLVRLHRLHECTEPALSDGIHDLRRDLHDNSCSHEESMN